MKPINFLLINIVVLSIQFGCTNSNPVSANSPPDVLWERNYGGSGYDNAYQVIESNDHGYVLVGRTDSFDQGADGFIMKTDRDGNLLWMKTFGNNSFDEIYSVRQTNDSGYILCGYTNISSKGADA